MQSINLCLQNCEFIIFVVGKVVAIHSIDKIWKVQPLAPNELYSFEWCVFRLNSLHYAGWYASPLSHIWSVVHFSRSLFCVCLFVVVFLCVCVSWLINFNWGANFIGSGTAGVSHSMHSGFIHTCKTFANFQASVRLFFYGHKNPCKQ